MWGIVGGGVFFKFCFGFEFFVCLFICFIYLFSLIDFLVVCFDF